MCIVKIITSILLIILSIILLVINNMSFNKTGSSEKYVARKKSDNFHYYIFHKYANTNRKYSEKIEQLLKNDKHFTETKSDMMVDWSDKNSKSRVKDYYPFDKISFVDKKYLPILFPDIIPNTYINGDFEIFIKKINGNVFFLKPADKYIGGSEGIEIENDPYKLYDKFIVNKFVIQEEVNPMLINNYKFDIRTYVLIVFNKQYMHVYYNYGIIRYCKDEYVMGSIDPDKQITINGKFDYVINIDILEPFLIDIKNIIYKTLIDLKIPNEIGYQYLGYDIIFSNERVPYLLEINIQPSLSRVNYDIDILNNFSEWVIKSVLTNNRGYNPFMTFHNNIILVEPNIIHLNDLYEITKNIEIMQYIGNLKIWTYEKTKKFIEYGPSDNYYYKAVMLNKTLIGIIGIYKNKTNYYNLTIFINKEYMGKGISNQVLNIFLLTVDKKPIYADVLNSNIRSIKFFKKLNYSFTLLKNIHRFIIA